MRFYLFWISVIFSCSLVKGLDNELALMPPMGWTSWLAFGCQINENIVKQMADILYDEGYATLGYQYVTVDDCWQSSTRDINGRLQPDPYKFPSGMKALADYVHSKGLKFGIFTDVGNLTGTSKPGSEDHFQIDAVTFAEWGVDYVKASAVSAMPSTLDIVYPQFGYYLKETTRPMVYATSWPVYQLYDGIETNYYAVSKNCNTWRVYGDMTNNWETIAEILEYVGYRSVETKLNAYSGPGAWNDLDVLAIGNDGLTADQSKAQLTMWSILVSPLLMSTDLSKITPEIKSILQNGDVIAINQDPLGIRGVKMFDDDGIQVWVKPIMPIINEKYYSYAIALLNRRKYMSPSLYNIKLRMFGLTNPNGYFVTELLQDSINFNNRYTTDDENINVYINSTGVVLLKVEAAHYIPATILSHL